MRLKSIAWCLSTVTVMATPVWAAPASEAALQPHVDLGIERFVWQEYRADGRRLLRESGPRVTLGLAVDEFGRPSSGFLYALSGRVYLGRVDYDGQTQNGVPLTSDTFYGGATGEATGGYRFGDRHGIDVLGTIGVDEWRREIASSIAADGQATGKAVEDYFILYGKAGLGAYLIDGPWRNHLQVGMKQPLYAREYSENFALTLSPGSETSVYGQWDVSYALSGRRRLGARLYYDSFRFSESNHLITTLNGSVYEVWQPESHMDVWGVQAAYYF